MKSASAILWLLVLALMNFRYSLEIQKTLIIKLELYYISILLKKLEKVELLSSLVKLKKQKIL